MKRSMIFATVTAEELAIVRRMADRDELTISNFMRRAINSLLLEEGLDTVLLEEHNRGRRKRASSES